jgi:transposase
LSAGDPLLPAQQQGTVKAVIVIGADTHKRSHTVAVIEAASGRSLADQTVPARRHSSEALLAWARRHGTERVWAIEDCRHVSGALERFLLGHGEAVVPVAPKLTVRERASARERGKSDAIDAVAIARAALREGINQLPQAQLAGPELDVRLLVDHRERLVRQRTALSNDLRRHLHDLWPETVIPPGAFSALGWQTRIAARLARCEQTARVHIARDKLRRIRELTRTINELQAELGALVAALAPRLLAEPGCGVLTAPSSSARSPTSPASAATPSSPAPPAPHPSRPPPDARNDTASITAATVRSIAPCTVSRSPKAAWTPRAPPTSPAAKPKARPAAKPSAASNATSPAASGTSSNPTPRPPCPPALQPALRASSRSTATDRRAPFS